MASIIPQLQRNKAQDLAAGSNQLAINTQRQIDKRTVPATMNTVQAATKPTDLTNFSGVTPMKDYGSTATPSNGGPDIKNPLQPVDKQTAIAGMTDPYQQRQAVSDLYKQEGLVFGSQPQNDIQATSDFLQNQKDSKSALETQLDQATVNARKARDQAVSADTSAFSTSREGGQSGSTPMLQKDTIGSVQDQYASQRADIDAKQKQLDQLQQQQQGQYLSSRADQITAAQTALNNSKKTLLETSEKAKKDAQDLMDKAQTQVNTLVTSFGKDLGNVDAKTLTSYVNSVSSGLSDAQKTDLLSRTLALQSISKQIDELSKSKAPEDIKNVSDLLNVFDRMKVPPSDAVKNAAALDYMTRAGVDQKVIDAFKVQAGITDKNKVTSNGSGGYTIMGKDGPINVPNGIAVPKGDKYNYDITPNGGLKIDIKAGVPAGQCGSFTNDVLGTRVFGDDFSQKKQMVNSFDAVPGAAFIMDTGDQYGHVGIVEAVNPDGSISVVDSNYHNKSNPETCGRRTIQKGTAEYKSIVGYYIPKTATTGKDIILSQIRNGDVTPSEYSSFRDKAVSEGWANELDKVINDPKNKPITAKQSDEYGVDAALNQRQFDDLIQKREDLGYGNKFFQALGQKGPDGKADLEGMQQFLQLGTNIKQAKDIWEQFKAEGGGLSGLIDTPVTAVNKLADAAGLYTTKEVELYRKLQALTGEALSNYVSSISGAAVSEAEFQRLKQNKPNVDMTDTQFEDQLNRMMDNYDASLKAKTGRYGFKDQFQLQNAIQGYGKMPTNINETLVTDQDQTVASKWGYDATQDDIYTSTFSSPR